MSGLGPLDMTPRSDERPLCLTCKQVSTMRDEQGRITIRCSLMGCVVQRKLVYCSSYYPHNEPWLNEYESTAWLWTSEGFIRLRDFEQRGGAPLPAVGFAPR